MIDSVFKQLLAQSRRVEPDPSRSNGVVFPPELGLPGSAEVLFLLQFVGDWACQRNNSSFGQSEAVLWWGVVLRQR